MQKTSSNFTDVKKLVSALLCVAGISLSIAQAVPFSYTPTSIVPASGDLPDNGCAGGNGVTVTFNVTDDFNINDVDLGINITHTYRGDLVMNLSSPTTANIDLLTADGGDGNDNLNVLFNSDSVTPIAGVDHAITPNFVNDNQPENATALDAFDSEDALGIWTFFVCDNFGADTGTLTAAELIFDGTPNILAPNTISGNVYKELDSDGVIDPIENGVQNVTVTAYDTTGAIAGVGSVMTDANGDYAITGLTDTETYRIEFTNVPNSYVPAITGTDSSSSVTFATSPVEDINYAVWAPAQFCQADPDLVTNLFLPLNQTTGSALISFPYSSSGTSAFGGEANYNQIGSTWGLAYQSESDVLFASAYLKRHVEFGPGGVGSGAVTGSIYRIDNPKDGMLSTVSEFLNLNDIFGSNVTGVNPHPNPATDLTVDAASYANIGKISLGDMDISADSSELWVINLTNRNLYQLPLGDTPSAPVVPTLADVTAIDMLNTSNYVVGDAPACAGGNTDNFRPFAVKFHLNQVFVGAVCSAETGGAGLTANIYALDTSTLLFTEVLDFSLTYNRGCGLQNGVTCLGGAGLNSANWNPWASTFPPAGMVSPNGNERAYPQPIVSDIEFTADNQMIIGFRDRWGDQTGHQQQAPDNSGLIRGEGYGDIVRATFNAGSSTWSFNAVEATDNTEFYSADSWSSGGFSHEETGFGGLVSMTNLGSVVMTNMDPINLGGATSDFAGGVRTYNINTGANINSYQIYTATPANTSADFFGKANGLGDLEALCDTPDSELGNRVWNDSNANGRQDPGESGIGGLTVQMIDTDGSTILATVVTDADGEFYFTTAAGVDVVGKNFDVNFLPNINNYLFRIATNQAPLTGLMITPVGGGGLSVASNDIHDSDAVLSGAFAQITVASGFSGQSDHSYDFGFTDIQVADLSLNKLVDNSTPVIGTSVTFEITVTNDGPDDATNVTVVDTVPSGFSGITAISGSGMAAGNIITWSGLNIPNGANVVLTFDVTVEPTGVYNNLAEVTASDQIDSDSTPNNGVNTDGDGDTNNDPGDEDDGDGEPVAPVSPGACFVGDDDIGGFVFLDANENGDQDGAELGFFAASLVVTAYDNLNIAVASDNINVDGSYVLPGLAGSSYRLELTGLPAGFEFSTAGSDAQSSVRFVNSADCDVDFGVSDPVGSATVEIGNRVWNDADGDGIQDSDEVGIDGISVTLTCGADSVSTLTTNGGLYYFNNAATVNAGTTQALFMDSGENCSLTIDDTQSALNFFTLTDQNADMDTSNNSQTDVRDSDASTVLSNSTINFTVGAIGENNHSYDFGFEPITPLIDFGDAPDTANGTGAGNYQTTNSDNGPSHIINNNIYMGAGAPDNEIDGQPNAFANGDDNTATLDEDGPQSILNFDTGSTPSVQVLVTNQTGLPATLSGWIDYNGDGVFDTVTEGSTANVATGAMTSIVTLTFPVMPASPSSVTFLRLRLSTDVIALTPLGLASNGEIEDHRVTLNGDLSGDPQLCYSLADGGDRLITFDPISGAVDDTAPGLGHLPYTFVETMAWDLGDPLTSGDEVLYGININRVIQLLPAPRSQTASVFNNGITDSDGFAIDWQSSPPVYYGSGNAGNGHRNIFNFNPATANVLNVSPDITLPLGNTQIDDLAWDPINRRLLGLINNDVIDTRIVEFDLSNYPATAPVFDCGRVNYFDGTSNVVLQDGEGLTFTRGGNLIVTTGNGGLATTSNTSWKIPISDVLSDCSISTQDMVAQRIGPQNNLTLVPSGSTSVDHESVACGISLTESDASIGNRVWLDEDGDGDQDGGEDGIGGVTVYLCRSNAAPCDSASAVRSTVTDANGGYLFPGLPLLDYIVAVDTSTVPANLVSNPTYDEDSGTSAPDNQTVVSLDMFEEEHLTADFGYNWNEPQQTNIPPPGTTGSIGDRVWIDTDADGVQDVHEPGINSVTVNLFTDSNGDGVFDNLVATTTTDANGNYVFDNLAASAYVVEVNPITLPVGVIWTQTGDPDNFAVAATNPDHRTTHPVILAPGDVFVNADFGYQGDAANTHTIGDTVFLDADANGSQGAEPGIANVTLTLLDASGKPLANTTTDSNGQYLFTGLPDGTYSVVVTDTNNILAPLEQSADPDATLDNRSTINLSGGDDLLQDFGYTPEGHVAGLGLIGDTIYFDVDGNSSQSSTEPGIEGVRVELIASNGLPFAVTVTDENGHYYFASLPDDDYTVIVDISTLPNAGVGMVNTDDPNGGTVNESDTTIAGGNIDLIQDFGYQVAVPNTIGGTIWRDNDADGTQDGGETLEFNDVTVVLLDAQGNVIGKTVTDINGDYEFTGLPDGTYTILVTDDDNRLAGHWLTEGANPGSDLNSQVVGYSVSVAGGTNNQTGDFGYYVNLARIGNIVYRDDNNDGMRNAATEPGIPLVPVTLTITYPNTDTVTITTLTDAAGFYSFENLLADDSFTGDIANGPQPTYSITVGSVAAGFTSTFDGSIDTSGIGNGTDNNSDNDQGESAFPVKGNADLTNDFGFVPGATIGNRVWLDLDNDGVQDANEDGITNIIVQLTPPVGIDIGAGVNTPITTVTDTNGNYIFRNLPLANGYTLTVNNPPAGYTQTFDEDGTGTANTSSADLTIANEEYLTADFGYVTPAGSIGDYIWSDVNGDGQQDPGEVGINGVTVYLCDNNTPPCDAMTAIATTFTDATGRYLFTGVNITVPHLVEVDVTTLPAGYVQTGDPDGDGAPDNQTTVLALNGSGNINLDADFGYQPTIDADNSDIGDTIYLDLDNDGIEDVTEPGIPGIAVQLFIDTTADGTPDTPIASMFTNSSGQYLFPSLLNNEAYMVRVTDSNNILNGFVQSGDPDATLDNQSTIPTLVADNLDQDFGYNPLRRGNGVIGDRIFHDVDNSNTQNAGDQGLEGVTVRLIDNLGNVIDVVSTDENGTYLFTGLNQNDTYTVIVDTMTLPNGGVGWTNNIDPDGTINAQTVVDLSLTPSGINLDQDFGFISAVNNTIGGTVWSDNDGNGLLTDGTGIDPDESANGIENVTVVLTDTNGNIVATTTTDASGNYSFTSLPNGSYVVLVTDDNNELANLSHTDGPNADNNAIDDNSQDDTGYTVAVAGGQTNTTADFGYRPIITTPITLAGFKAAYDGNTGDTMITWSTLTETGNVGFELYAYIDGIWQQVNEEMIASEHVYKTGQTVYQYVYKGGYQREWAIVDIDIRGNRQSHGVFNIDQQYGKKEEVIESTKWQDINQFHQEKIDTRQQQKARDLNQYINSFKNKSQAAAGEGS